MHDPALIERLETAARVVVLSGAGMSAESGIPTFRDAQTGYWSRFRAEDLATPEAYARQPELVWRWYEERRAAVRRSAPNAGHRALAALAERFETLSVVTQNVDGLHQRAGSADVVELHGNLFVNRCVAKGTELGDDELDRARIPPRCRGCGAAVRPGVVWFGELLPAAALASAEAAVADADALLAVGTSSLVYPAAGLAEQALAGGTAVIEVNPAATPLSRHADFRIAEPAAVALPLLADDLLDQERRPWR